MIVTVKRIRQCVFSMLVFCLVSIQAVWAVPTVPLANNTQMIHLRGVDYPVRLPAGYRLELLVSGLNAPRLLTFADNGDLFLGSRSGRIYRLAPPYEKAQVLVDMGGYPNSVAFRPGEILIARTEGLYRAAYTMGQTKLPASEITLLAALPNSGGHRSRTVVVGPDGRVYVGLGISGNCSNEYLHASYPFDKRRGGVMVLDESGEHPVWQMFANGLRNPIGLAWHPQTKVLFATNNGADHQGFEQPPEYLSKLEENSFHGMPWYQSDGQQIRRDDCIDTPPPQPLAKVIPPVATFPARNAPMGLTFVTQDGDSILRAGDVVVALHGSWAVRTGLLMFGDKSTRRPPALVRVRFSQAEAGQVEDLVSGMQLPDGGRWARPVGVAIGPEGAVYFSSDQGIQGVFRLTKKTASQPK